MGELDGMNFSAEVHVPTGFAEGLWQYVQLVNRRLIRKLESGHCQETNHYSEWVLDESFPYAGPWNTGSPQGEFYGFFGDTPGYLLVPVAVTYYHEQYFRLYVMFKPSGAGSEWVPLEIIHWDWETQAVKSGAGEWSLASSDTDVGDPAATTIHPEWAGNIDDEPLWLTDPVPCP